MCVCAHTHTRTHTHIFYQSLFWLTLFLVSAEKLPNIYQQICQTVFQDLLRGGRVVRWCWVNFQYRGVLLLWISVGQGPTALAVGAGGFVWTFFLSSIISLFFLPLSWGRARYRLKYCLNGPLKPKQPTSQSMIYCCFPFIKMKKRWSRFSFSFIMFIVSWSCVTPCEMKLTYFVLIIILKVNCDFCFSFLPWQIVWNKSFLEETGVVGRCDGAV